MNAISLLFLLLSFSFTFVHGFLNRFYKKKTMYTILNTTCFDNNDRDKNNQKIHSINADILPKNPLPLYTILWYDCEDCKMLMDDMKKLHMNFEYIDIHSTLIVNQKLFINETKQKPTFLLNQEYFGSSLFEMYEKIFVTNKLLQ